MPKGKISKFLIKTIIVFSIFVFSMSLVRAQYGNMNPDAVAEGVASGQIGVSDGVAQQMIEALKNLENEHWLEKLLFDKNYKLDELLASAAFKASVSKFLNQLAYETATYMATGDAGQNAMFFTDGWDNALTNVADNAAGYFLDDLNDLLEIDLCNPDLSVKTRIQLGIAKPHISKPDCTFSKLKNNWEAELNDPNFLNKFQTAFDPWENDLGIALSVHTRAFEKQDEEVNNYILERLGGDGFKPVRDTVSGLIKTPASLVAKQAGIPLEHAVTGELNWKGIGATAIDTFLSTLIGNLLDEWFKDGLVSDPSSSSGFDWSSLRFGDASPAGSTGSGSGTRGAQERFRQLLEPNFSVRGDYNILRDLIKCPDPTDAGPTDCVITENFRQAVVERLTVAQALEQGYLNPNGIFGFSSDGLEPPYNEGYPYRSMVILRKFRIIPMGWELAAQYMKDHPEATDGTRNISDLVACYDEDDEFEGYYSGWCENLVDPFWVLKAPLNYCKKEGAGPIILSESVSGQGDKSRLVVSREGTYCADEQTCIQENQDGSCRLYGYCTEERRKWDFDGQSCNPLYNTCQTFRTREGRTFSYLENTIDYGTCNADNVGCLGYCEDYNNVTDNFDCTVSSGDKLFLDKDAEECSAEQEGCHEFIRSRPGDRVNILPNASFENDLDNWTPSSGAVVTSNAEALDGSLSLEISGAGERASYVLAGISENEQFSVSYSINSNLDNSGGPMTGPWLQVRVQTLAGTNILDPLTGDDWVNASVPTDTYFGENNWYRRQFTFVTPAGTSQLELIPRLDGVAGTAYFDAIKVEKGPNPSAYSAYGDGGRIYQKLAPDYLGCSGGGGPAECGDYVRYCDEVDVGCNLYTAVRDRLTVPGRVIATDYCDEACIGYDSYLQTETPFEYTQPGFFIPATAQTCSAQAAGCDEFTNLDRIGEGAEAREYYSQLRQCAFPSASCSEFYTWEGSDETGYQLRVYTLDQDSGTGEPVITEDDSLECTETIYNLPPSDPAYNPDCREFYNTTGQISYHLYSRTITCSDNCHPYRRSRESVALNADGTNLTSAECTAQAGAEDYYYDGASGECHICKNGGEWRPDHEACIYMAIPGEGVQCNAAQEGCREYSGNAGSNMRILTNNNFEGSLAGWTGVGGSTAELSSNSLRIGGESLYVNGGADTIQLTLGNLVREGNNYVLQFIAQSAAGDIDLTARIGNATTSTDFAGSAAVTAADWSLYEFNIPVLNHNIANDEYLEVSGTGDFYIDDIRLTEIADRYYVIRDSWQTPDVCFQDVFGVAVGYQYNLGCDAYTDQENQRHVLRRFDRLCDEEVIGCELMIDTHNYSDYNGNIWNDNGDGVCDAADTADCESVAGDEPVYVVYDSDKECNARDKGCQYLGKPYVYGDQASYPDIYLNNDPDLYSDSQASILCEVDAEFCEEFSRNDGMSYFKDPGDQVCEWRQSYAVTAGWDWFIKQIKRCDANSDGVIDSTSPTAPELDVCREHSDCDVVTGMGSFECDADSDCGSGNRCVDGHCRYSCLLDENDIDCPTDASYGTVKTFGYGGIGSRIDQPAPDAISGANYVGLCPAEQSGCSEYIDPVSRFGTNAAFNSDFSQDLNSDGTADAWTASNQEIALKPYTLYVLAIETTLPGFSATVQNTTANLRELGEDNILMGESATVNVTESGVYRASKLFYTGAEVSGVNLQVSSNASGQDAQVILNEAMIDYQLAQDLSRDYCNGLVNFEDGCVLFNERTIAGSAYNALAWDADRTMDDIDGITPIVGAPADNDSNVILHVTPNRVCREWLACRSFIKDEDGNNVCFDISACDSVNENGECDSFVPKEQADQVYDPALGQYQFADMSGYAKAGYLADNSLEAEYYPFGAMEQEGEVAYVPNGNFEIHGDNDYPMGWSYENGSWDPNIFRTVSNPIDTQTECLNLDCGIHVPEGRSFLKLGSSYSTVSEFIDVVPGAEFALSGYVNTINLISGSVQIDIITYDRRGIQLTEIPGMVIIGQGEHWRPFKENFIVPPSADKVRIRLGSTALDPTGNFYFDDIKLRPNLRHKLGDFIEQTCRLYPENNSLACAYFEDSGVFKRGWLGYCLEYDRYPGHDDACLMWWPIDKVKGEGIEEGAGYSGRYPVYYAIDEDFINITTSDPGRIYFLHPGWIDDDWRDLHVRITANSLALDNNYLDLHDFLNADYISAVRIESTRNWFGGWMSLAESNRRPTPDGGFVVTLEEAAGDFNCFSAAKFDALGNFEWIAIDSADHSSNNSHYSTGVYDWAQVNIRFNLPYANRIVQAVTPVGRNKFWSGRVYEGSDYVLPNHGTLSLNSSAPSAWFGYPYIADYFPFGSLVNPSPSSNPYEWDGTSAEGNQPIFFRIDETEEVRAGYLHNEDTVSRIFAQSYGSWIWQDRGLCSGGGNHGGDCDFNECPGGTCILSGIEICGNSNNNGQPCDTIGFDCADCTYIEVTGNEIYRCDGTGVTCCEDGSASVAMGGYYCQTGANAGSQVDMDVCPNSEVCIGTGVTEIANEYHCGGDPLAPLCCSGTGATCQIGNVCDNQSATPGIACDPTQDECPGGQCLTDDGHYVRADTICAGNSAPCSPAVPCSDGSSCIGVNWAPPDNLCLNGVRPNYDNEYSQNLWCERGGNHGDCYDCSPGSLFCDFCGVPPQIEDIFIDDNEGNFIGLYPNIHETGFVNLTFNSIVDAQQLPLVMYAVNWGDDEITVVSGVEMRDRPPGVEEPHSMYHLYSYWDLLAKYSTGVAGIDCADAGGTANGVLCDGHACCTVQPGVRIKDNWGWCNNGIDGAPCPITGTGADYVPYGSYVVVYEN